MPKVNLRTTMPPLISIVVRKAQVSVDVYSFNKIVPVEHVIFSANAYSVTVTVHITANRNDMHATQIPAFLSRT